MHKTRRGIGEVSYCFLMSSVQFRGHGTQQNASFDSIWAFPDCKSKSNALHDGYGMTHKAERGMEEGPCCFSRPLVQFQGHIDQTSSLGRSQLSNPSDLPCWFMIALWRHIHEYCVHDLGRRIGTRLLPGPMLTHDQFEQTLLYPPLQRSWKGGILVSPCPSVRLWTESCPPCIFNNTHRIHFIFAHLIKQLQKVCRV